MIATLSVASMLASSVLAQSANGFICAEDQSTGFSFKTGRWTDASFKSSDKYVVTKAKGDEPGASGSVWIVKELGQTVPSFWCKSGFSEKGALRCEGIGGEFALNHKNGRFLRTYVVGYWTDNIPGDTFFKEGANTPHLAIGKCSPL